jgi:membrane protease YdiL (CAAX protease family)
MALPPPSWPQRALDAARRRPIIPALLYLGGAVLIGGVASKAQPDQNAPYAVVRFQSAVLPALVLLTAASRRLFPLPQPTHDTRPLAHGLAGAALGTGAYLAVVGVAVARHWVAFPAWGWERHPPGAVLRSIGVLTLGHLAVAWNEEQVFRGEGFDRLCAAIGTGPAAAVLVPLFAVYHGLDPAIWPGLTAGGLVLMLLRLVSGGLALPVGYHWAWNVVQTALLGPPDAEPSLRPMVVRGPARWMGRPGQPEPGLLPTLVHLAVAGGVALVGWLRRQQR